jgi:2-oxoglutarate dehydrogenase E1 component
MVANGKTFQRIMKDDVETKLVDAIKLADDSRIRRVILCSGKVCCDLYEQRAKRRIEDVYLLRVEQLHPVPLKALTNELSRSPRADVVWCQEEPKRPAAASPAVGTMSQHRAQLAAFMEQAFAR